MDTPKSIIIRREDVVTMVTAYQLIRINVEDYPELSGLSEPQMKNYIKKNAYQMRGIHYNTLGEDIEYSNIVDEKISDEFIDWVFPADE